jgi:hypothetical protein
MGSDIDKFLKACDGLKETEFHKRIVEPLLVELGATSIEYTHGQNERGNYFLFLTYGGTVRNTRTYDNGGRLATSTYDNVASQNLRVSRCPAKRFIASIAI